MEQVNLNAPLPDNAEDAQYEIDSIFANSEHPYFSRPGLPLQERAIERVTKLFEIKTRGQLDPVAQMCQDAVSEKAARDTTAQEKVDSEYAYEVKNLKQLGVDAGQVFSEGKTRPYHVRALQQGALLKLGRYTELGTSFREDFRKIKPSTEMSLELANFENSACNGLTDSCDAIGEMLISYVFDRNQELAL